MPDLDLIKQGEQGVRERDRRGRFASGRSGNPAGRPSGCRNNVNRAARLLLTGEGEALTRKAVALVWTSSFEGAAACREHCRKRGTAREEWINLGAGGSDQRPSASILGGYP